MGYANGENVKPPNNALQRTWPSSRSSVRSVAEVNWRESPSAKTVVHFRLATPLNASVSPLHS